MAEGQSYKYDAFVSYSHTADDLLAPRLQAGLQRFAKPWWRRRAIRVFRDEASLSASPRLWDSIAEALDSSSWLVLLLSPDAAQSEWVNKEIDYWKSDSARRDRVVPVVTDGEFLWDEDVRGSAVPPSLGGVFDAEPRWVDMRSVEGESQLDLKNPAFASAVADVASAVRGVSKDELESEEVRQHRRTIRTAWAAGIVVLLLGVAASVAAVFAFNQRAIANDNAALAVQEADRANLERDRANQLAEDEEEARMHAEELQAEAERRATIAQSQTLVLEAEGAVGFDPELAIRLALAAIRGFQETGQDLSQATSALRSAIAANRVVAHEAWGTPIAVHPFQDRIATVSSSITEPGGTGYDVVTRDVKSGSVHDECTGGGWRSRPARMVLSSTGSMLALVDSATGGVFTCDLRSGRWTLIGTGSPDLGLAFSPDERLLAWSSESDAGVVVYEIEEERVVYRSNDGGSGPSFSPDGLLAFVADGLHIFSPETGQLVSSNPGEFGLGVTSWAPDGSLIAIKTSDEEVIVVDANSGAEVSRTADPNSSGPPVWLSESERFLLGGSLGLRVVDANSGEVVTQLLGAGTNSSHYGPVPGSTEVVAAIGGEVIVIDTASAATSEVAQFATSMNSSGPARYISDGTFALITDGGSAYVVADATTGDLIGSGNGDGEPIGRPIVSRNGLVVLPHADLTWTVTSAITAETLYRSPPGWFVQGIDELGTSVVIFDGTCEGPFVVDVTTSEPTRPPAQCTDEFPSSTRRFVFSPSRELVVGSSDGLTETVLFDMSAGVGVPIDGGGPVVSFNRDGSKLFALDGAGTLRVFSVARLLEGFSGVEAVLLPPIDAHADDPTWLAESPDGSLVATAALGEPVRLWDLTSGDLLGEFGGEVASTESHYFDFHPLEPWLLVASPPNEVRIYTLDLDELIAIAESRLKRELTPAECQQYPGACPP